MQIMLFVAFAINDLKLIVNDYVIHSLTIPFSVRVGVSARSGAPSIGSDLPPRVPRQTTSVPYALRTVAPCFCANSCGGGPLTSSLQARFETLDKRASHVAFSARGRATEVESKSSSHLHVVTLGNAK